MGYYKIYPEIPSELSERAKSFILRCFKPNPDIRATAAKLLEDPLMSKNLNLKHNTIEFYSFYSCIIYKIFIIEKRRAAD